MVPLLLTEDVLMMSLMTSPAGLCLSFISIASDSFLISLTSFEPPFDPFEATSLLEQAAINSRLMRVPLMSARTPNPFAERLLDEGEIHLKMLLAECDTQETPKT